MHGQTRPAHCAWVSPVLQVSPIFHWGKRDRHLLRVSDISQSPLWTLRSKSPVLGREGFGSSF